MLRARNPWVHHLSSVARRSVVSAFGAAVAVAAVGCTAGPASAQPAYELVWADDFDGPALDTSKWAYQTGDGSQYGLNGWGNQEKQWYTTSASNVATIGGFLVITAREQQSNGYQYTSGRIRTAGLASFRYGRIEGRIKLPSTSGAWPAFWMLPENSPYGGWPAGGEIDIMESVNEADRVYGALHFGGPGQHDSTVGSFADGTDFSEDFHVYAVEWEPDEIRWYIDDVHFKTVRSDRWWSSAGGGNPRAPFDQNFHLLLNIAVGGAFPGHGTPDQTASFPQLMVVDYVRVYAPGQQPFLGQPHAIPGAVQAEDFDAGADGVAYSDCDSTNNGGAYRPDSGVDIEASTVDGYNLGWMCTGEWVEYTVDVAEAGRYRMDALVASLSAGGAFGLEFDGVDKTGTVAFFNTGGWQTWETVSREIELDAGEQVMRFVCLNSGGFNINRFAFTLLEDACAADLAEPAGVLDIDDVLTFLSSFASFGAESDLAEPFGTHDIDDVLVFLSSFSAGCS